MEDGIEARGIKASGQFPDEIGEGGDAAFDLGFAAREGDADVIAGAAAEVLAGDDGETGLVEQRLAESREESMRRPAGDVRPKHAETSGKA